MSTTIFGTSHFVSRAAAVRYYRAYGYNAREVDAKIRERDICIGPPTLDTEAGDKLVRMDDGLRYGIEKIDPVPRNPHLDNPARGE